MSTREIEPEVLDAIAQLGFDVYQAVPAYQGMRRSYLFFTDGQHIGYLQTGEAGGLELSTVHIPNRTTGTGFKMGEAKELTREVLETAFLNAPGWAYGRDRASVCKWPSVEAWLQSAPPLRYERVREAKPA